MYLFLGVFYVWNAISIVQLSRYILNLQCIPSIVYCLARKYMFILRFNCKYEGNDFKISGVCFIITYLMTNQSLISTYKRSIFLKQSQLMSLLMGLFSVIFTTRSLIFLACILVKIRYTPLPPEPQSRPEYLESTHISPYIDS